MSQVKYSVVQVVSEEKSFDAPSPAITHALGEIANGASKVAIRRGSAVVLMIARRAGVKGGVKATSSRGSAVLSNTFEDFSAAAASKILADWSGNPLK